MDTIAHGLWTYLVFRKDKFWRYAVLFAVLPDLPFLLSILYNFLKTGVFNLFLENCPYLVYFSGEFMHSLPISLFVFLVSFLIFKKRVLFLLAWPLHIVIDIFTHARGNYATEFLFPFSDYSFNGLNWVDIYFLIVNYSLLIIFYCFVYKNVKYNKNHRDTKKRV